MKIRVKQINWSGWKGGSSSEKQMEFNVELNKEIVVKDIKKTTIDKISYIETIFAFKVIKIDEDFVLLETHGSAGGKYDKDEKAYLPRLTNLNFNDVATFKTSLMDAGTEFEVTCIK